MITSHASMRCLAFALAVICGTPAQAQQRPSSWPERPIRVIVPFQPGGIADVTMRIVGQKLGDRLGQQIVVENRVGAGGRVGTEAVARADADGYTLGFANTSTHAIAATIGTGLTYDPVKDFAPIAMLGSSPFVMAVHPGVKAASVSELVALAKANPRSLTFASAGTGTMAQLAGALFERLARVELVHVPYRGTNQAMVDLMEGRIDIQFGTIPPTLQYIRSGNMRALAVTGSRRSPSLPDVPTVAESGITGYELSLWQAIVGPVALPATIVERLDREIAGVLAEPDTIAQLDQQGIEREPLTRDALGRLIASDVAKWRDIVGSGKSMP